MKTRYLTKTSFWEKNDQFNSQFGPVLLQKILHKRREGLELESLALAKCLKEYFQTREGELQKKPEDMKLEENSQTEAISIQLIIPVEKLKQLYKKIHILRQDRKISFIPLRYH